MTSFLRSHWFDLGLGLAVVTAGGVLLFRPGGLSLLLWLSLISLFLHQAEEYRYPGYFPGMMNVVMFNSDRPERYPLNPQIAMLINVSVGWLTYFLAALLAGRAIWLAIAAMLVSLGNFVAHTFLFNIKGKTRYNPGMLTAILLFLPLTVIFFSWIIRHQAATPLDWVAGILLGLVLNFVGILKMIDWLKDEHTPYAFSARFMIPTRR